MLARKIEMSRNFDLLRSVGQDQELFQVDGQVSVPGESEEMPNSVGPAANVHPSSGRPAASPHGPVSRPMGRTMPRPPAAVSRPDVHRLTPEEEVKLVQRVFLASGCGKRTVLFAGVEEHAGAAAICARSAELIAAQVRGTVCVVDANLRQPSLHHRFGVEILNGLADGLRDGNATRGLEQVKDNLWLLPSGPREAEPYPLLAPDGLRFLFKCLREEFDYVLINAPPFVEAAESINLSQLTDGVVLVVEAHVTRRERARKVKEALDAAQVTLLGIVLNNRRFPIPEAIYRRL